MAAKKYFSNLDLNQNQIKSAVLETTTSAGVASPGNGQIIFDTGSNVLKYYDGATWQSPVGRFDGAVVYKGSIAHNAASPGTVANGDLYAFTSAGIATNYGGTYVEAGDFAVYDANAEIWTIIQGNVVEASTSSKGIVQLTTDEDAIDGVSTDKAVVPSTLLAWADETDVTEANRKQIIRKRVYASQTINSSGLTLTHSIGKNNPYVSVYSSSGQRVHLEVTKGDGTVVLTSNVELSGATVVISA
jgi:hypothetical protein